MAKKFAGIIIVHWSDSDFRSEAMVTSITSLIENTDYPYELIVIDNGVREEDTDFLLQLVKAKKINTLIINAENLNYFWGRNQALAICNGDYIVTADNDIQYRKGWLAKCVSILEAYPDKKIYATPIYNVAHWSAKYWKDEVLELNGEKWRLNRRAGSNCFVIRRKDFIKLGRWPIHNRSGTKWVEATLREGYWAAVTPELMAKDLGFRRGFNFMSAFPIFFTLSDGTKVYYNCSSDKYRKKWPDLNYKDQGVFYIR